MKKTLLVLCLCLAVAAAGCKKKEEAPKAPPAPTAKPGMPADATHGGDPHAGLKPMEIPSAPNNHKGKVLETMNAGGYSYVYIEQADGKKTWVAAPPMEVKKGEELTFQPGFEMSNFTSKTLNRTFDKIIFTNGLAR